MYPTLVLAGSLHSCGGGSEVIAAGQSVKLTGARGGVVSPRTSAASVIFADRFLYGAPSQAVGGFNSPVFFESPVSVPADTHWLEGVSDLYPTRVSDSASSDPVFLNSKDLRSLDRHAALGSTQLFG